MPFISLPLLPRLEITLNYQSPFSFWSGLVSSSCPSTSFGAGYKASGGRVSLKTSSTPTSTLEFVGYSPGPLTSCYELMYLASLRGDVRGVSEFVHQTLH